MVKTQDFQNQFTKDLTFTDKQGYDFLENSNLFGGELVLSNVGSIGKIFIVPKLNKPMTLAPNAIMIRLFNEKHLIWIYYVFQSIFGLELLLSISSATAIKKFNKTDFKTLLIPIPPLSEQKRIIDRIEQIEPLLQQYDKLEKQLTKLENEITDKLKKSILQYAIEGKLVKQDPNDEPASVLLERIKAEKEKLLKEGKIKRDKNESYIYQGDDKNYYEKLPNNWILTTLSAAGSWKSGSTPDRHNTKFYNGKIPWIKTGELNDNLNLIKAEEYVTELALERYALPINKPGNVLVAMYGATIGKLAINDIPVTTNQACCGCSPYEGIFNKYLFYFIMANKQKLIDLGAGGAQPNISKEKIQKFYFLVPPYREQIRMVRKIELVINILE